MVLLAALLLASAGPPPPTTVNGQTLGKVEKFTTAGPARVCIRNLMITALPGETISLGYAGIHSGTLRLNRGTSYVEARLGEIWRQPREVGEVIERRPNFYIADVSDDSKLRYGLFAPEEPFDGPRLLVWVEGTGLFGDQGDLSILKRIEFRQAGSPPCDVTYNFGWHMLFGEEPLVVKRKR